MIDTASVDLLGLIGRDVKLRRVASTNGGEYAGPCPFCGGRDRFRVWPARGRFWCRKCGAQGDAIDYIRRRNGLGFREAVEALGLPGRSTGPTASLARLPSEPLAPPNANWQERGRVFAAECEVALWSEIGARALAWLRGRGLSDDVIREARLGYNAQDRWEDRGKWGLGPGRPIWLPRGIVIPWEIEGNLWRINIRRPLSPAQEARGEPKYIGPAGWANALYNADRLEPGRPAVLVEGELDALTVRQHAGDLAVTVATGSVGGARRTRWLARLAIASLVLVAFDADDAGEEASAYWLKVLPNARRWRPYWGDANAMARDGADLRAWVMAGLGECPTAPDGIEAEAKALLALANTMDADVWAQKWAALAKRAGWPCQGMDWDTWADPLVRRCVEELGAVIAPVQEVAK